MRMDHHCQWVDNCIHEDNHKYFLQTITLGIVISILTILHFAINIIWAGKCKHASCIMMYVAVVLSGVVSIFLSFLTLDHCCNLFRGQTSYGKILIVDKITHSKFSWFQNIYIYILYIYLHLFGICLPLCFLCSPSRTSLWQRPLFARLEEELHGYHGTKHLSVDLSYSRHKVHRKSYICTSVTLQYMGPRFGQYFCGLYNVHLYSLSLKVAVE